MTAPVHPFPAAGRTRVRGWARRIGLMAPRMSATAPAPVRRPRPAPVSPPAPPRPTAGEKLRAWAELLRVPALFTVPGDVLAGAAAVGVPARGRTAVAVGASLCLYEAGMALNDWADREEDAVERPGRPIPSGRVRPEAALGAAGALTVAGLALASRAGRPALLTATAIAGVVWAYDLKLKHTQAGPAAMAAARSLDLLLGAAAAAGTVRPALAPAAVLAGHAYALTTVSRRETVGGSPAVPLAALAVTGAMTGVLLRPPAPRSTAPGIPLPAAPVDGSGRYAHLPVALPDAVRIATAAGYAVTFARPLVHAALNPSAALTRRAVGKGILAMMPLQGSLMARAQAPWPALLTVALAPVAVRLARKVSCT